MVIWKHYLDKYSVSNTGLIKNDTTGRILQSRLDKKGYLRCSISINGKIQTVYPHRLVGLLFVEGYDRGLTVDHIDGNKTNNRASNLEWVTNNENTQRAIKNGLRNTNGEHNPNAKLTKNDVIWIREHYDRDDKNFNTKAIAKKYKVGHTTIREIVSGKKWKDL